MRSSDARPTNVAAAIAKGLVRSDRAHDRVEKVGDVLRLERKNGGDYWITFDGRELRQGMTLGEAEPLQPSFVTAMTAAGRR